MRHVGDVGLEKDLQFVNYCFSYVYVCNSLFENLVLLDRDKQ